MTVKTLEEIMKLKEGGGKLAAILEIIKKETKPGVSTMELDKMAEQLILKEGGVPSFKGYKGGKDAVPFPATMCISVNDEVVHGMPGKKILKEGDIVGLDIGMKYKGLFTDMAETVIVGNSKEKDPAGDKLVKVTKESLELAISVIRPGLKTGDLGNIIQSFIEAHGFGVVRQLVGHGVGHAVHEEPQIPNWGTAGEGVPLKENMVIAIEPMVTEGDYNLCIADDGWTWKTKDGSRAAHFEHTMAVKKVGAEVLTSI